MSDRYTLAGMRQTNGEDRKTGKRAHLIHALDTYLNEVWFRDDMTDDEADEVGDAIDDTLEAVINALNQAMDRAENERTGQ